MFLLTKLFRARDSLNEKRSRWDDVEKPFLDHLEDLRIMFTKIVLTLAVSVVVCFIFHRQLMEIVRYPIRLAGLEEVDGNKLPDEKIKRSDWAAVKSMAFAAGRLAEADRAAFLERVPEELSDAVRATELFRAALALPRGQRESFIEAALPEGGSREIALFLVKNNPDSRLDEGGQLLRMTALGPAESFTLSLKLSFYAAIIITFPLLLWYIAEFILPGLTDRERRVLYPSVAIGFGLFLGGVCFAYFGVLPRALRFFHEYSLALGVLDDWRIGYFVSFVVQFSLVFGICFELPVVVMALVKLGILGYASMSRSRSYAVLTIFVTAAILTPTGDALTLSLLAVPMCILYEICIWMAWGIERKERKKAEQEEREWQESRLRPAVAGVPAGAVSVNPPPETDIDGVEHETPPYALGDREYDHGGEGPEYDTGEIDADQDDGDEDAEPITGAEDDLPPHWGHTADPYAPDYDPDPVDPWANRAQEEDDSTEAPDQDAPPAPEDEKADGGAADEESPDSDASDDETRPPQAN